MIASSVNTADRHLEALVEIDSISALSNEPVIAHVEACLGPRGWNLERFPYRDANGIEKINLLASLGGSKGEAMRPHLALVGHADVMPWRESWPEGGKLQCREGRLYGRGTCDMKGFLAASLAVLQELAPGDLAHSVALLVTADEEIGCIGAKKLVQENRIHPRLAIVGEPTSMRPVRAGKGYGLAEITIHGRAAHSAFPSAGVSAIFNAGRVLSAIEGTAAELQSNPNPAFEPPFTTLNVGLIQGGTMKNVIPSECRLTLEWRPVAGVPADEMVSRLERRLEPLRSNPDFRCEVAVRRLDPGFETPPDAQLVRMIEEITGLPAGAISYNSEAPQLCALGAETIVWGPGDMRVCHRPGENLAESEFGAFVEQLRRCVTRSVGRRK